MNKGIKRAAMVALSASLVMTSLAGCSKKADAFDADATVLTVNDEELAAGVVKFAVHYSQAQTQYIYDAYFGDNSFIYEYTDGYTIGDMALDSCIESFEYVLLANQHAEEYGVELTEDDEAAISEAAAAFIEDNDEEVLEAISATQEIVEEYLTLLTIQTRMEVAMAADVDTEVSDEEAAQRRVQYVYVETEDETEEEAEEETESEAADTEEAESGSTAEDETSEEAETAEETAVETEEETDDSDEESETALLTSNTATKTTSSDETETESTEEETDAAEETEEEETAEEASEAEEATEGESETEEEAETETETETETEDPEVVAAMERAYEKAEEIIALVQDGMTLEEAALEVDEDLSVTETTFGADSTSVADGLITATEDLEDETLVEYPIEATSGCYVAYVVSAFDEEATEEEKESIVEERKEEAIEALYEEWEEESEITIDEDVLATITFDFNLSLYEEEETEEEETEDASEESEAEEETETGSEEESESETDSEEETESETEAVTEAETESEEETAEAETEEETDAESESETETNTEEE